MQKVRLCDVIASTWQATSDKVVKEGFVVVMNFKENSEAQLSMNMKP